MADKKSDKYRGGKSDKERGKKNWTKIRRWTSDKKSNKKSDRNIARKKSDKNIGPNYRTKNRTKKSGKKLNKRSDIKSDKKTGHEIGQKIEQEIGQKYGTKNRTKKSDKRSDMKSDKKNWTWYQRLHRTGNWTRDYYTIIKLFFEKQSRFYMTSLKFKPQNHPPYWDFTFIIWCIRATVSYKFSLQRGSSFFPGSVDKPLRI